MHLQTVGDPPTAPAATLVDCGRPTLFPQCVEIVGPFTRPTIPQTNLARMHLLKQKAPARFAKEEENLRDSEPGEGVQEKSREKEHTARHRAQR